MTYTIKPCRCLCILDKFEINGIEADYEDFGSKEDRAPELAEPYCCGNMQFIPKLATQDILDKYNINVTEYNKICDELQCLSFGSCGWCS